MSEVLFDVVFKGKFVNSIDKSKAILHFSKLFKLSQEKADRFFDGKPRTLKKSLTMEKASHFRAALKKAGLRVSLSKIKQQETDSGMSELTMAEPGAIIVNKPFVQPKSYDVKQFALDDVGVTLVKYHPVEKKHYNLNNLKVEEVGSVMAEKPHVPEPDLDISDITMEQVGATFAEKENVKAPEFNLDGLDVEDVGAVFPQPDKPKEPKIDIDGIQLAD